MYLYAFLISKYIVFFIESLFLFFTYVLKYNVYGFGNAYIWIMYFFGDIKKLERNLTHSGTITLHESMKSDSKKSQGSEQKLKSSGNVGKITTEGIVIQGKTSQWNIIPNVSLTNFHYYTGMYLTDRGGHFFAWL